MLFSISKIELKKDLGVPDLSRFKERMVAQMQRKKESADRRAKLANLKRKALEKKTSVKTMEEYAAEARSAAKEQQIKLTEAPKDEEDKDAKNLDRSRKNYLKELQKVIEESDVLLQILDARDPMGCRNRELESHIVAKNKRIILVLNKIDLIPP